MKHSLRNISSIMAMVAIGAMMACDSWIYDDLADCPQEVVFHFYRQIPCETQPYYPADIREVRVYAFDDNDVLAGQFTATNLTLTRDTFLTVPFDQQGDFRFVAWAAASFDNYSVASIQPGVTTRQQLMLALSHPDGIVQERPAPLYMGELSSPLGRHYQPGEGTHRDTVRINMQQLTYRVNLTVYGLDASAPYDAFITDDNDQYDFYGHIVGGRPSFHYTSLIDRQGTVLRARYTTLRLAENRPTRLSIVNTATGREVFGTRLVDDLIMYRGVFGEPPYSLSCDHDFNVIIVLERDTQVTTETYMTVRATVNDWNVVYRNAVFR